MSDPNYNPGPVPVPPTQQPGYPPQHNGSRVPAILGATAVVGVVAIVAVVGVSIMARGQTTSAAPDTQVTRVVTVAAPQAQPQPQSTQTTIVRRETASKPTSTTKTSYIYDDGDGDVGVLTSLSSGSWITVLESMPKSSKSSGQAAAKAASISSRTGVSVSVVDSSSVPGLNSGYWAVSVIGSSSKSEAQRVCASVGRSVGGSCYPRLIG